MLNQKQMDVLMEEIYNIAKEDLRDEVYRELCAAHDNRLHSNEEIKELYNLFNYESPIVLRELRKELPLRIRLFNKVTLIGMELSEDNHIEYKYYFNKDLKAVFIYRPSISDMKNWSKHEESGC